MPPLPPKKQSPFQVIRPCFIRRMRHAIDFDDEPGLYTGEIGDEWADRMLPTESQTAEASATKPGPKDNFRFRHGLSKAAAKADCAEFIHEPAETDARA